MALLNKAKENIKKFGQRIEFSKLFPFYRDIFIASFFVNIFVLAMPIFTMNVYDRVLPNADQDTLIVLAIGLAIVFIFDFALRIVRSVYLQYLSQYVQTHSDLMSVSAVMHSTKSLETPLGGRLALMRHIAMAHQLWMSKIVPFAFDAPFIVAFIILIAVISKALAMVVLIAIILIFGFNYVVSLMAQEPVERKNKSGEEKASFMTEMFSGLQTIQSYGAQSTVMKRWSGLIASDSQNILKADMYQNITTHFGTFISSVMAAAVLIVGVEEVINGVLSVGGLIAVSILSGRCLAPINGFSTFFVDLKNYKDTKTRIDAMNAHIIGAKDTGDAMVSIKSDLDASVTLKDVFYSYPNSEKEALSKIDLMFADGGRYGIIGHTGAGKTTLSKVIAGVLAPSSGRVLWGHYQLDAISQAQKIEHISIASQEDCFFSGRLSDNVFLDGRTPDDVDPDLLKKILYATGLDLIIEQSGYGWDTMITEGGASLSVGQRQSISLARALCAPSKIIIFDEPMSGMDHMLEMRLKDGLAAVLDGKTFIMITHRTSLLSLVDHLVLLEKGHLKLMDKRDNVLKMMSGGAS